MTKKSLAYHLLFRGWQRCSCKHYALLLYERVPGYFLQQGELPPRALSVDSDLIQTTTKTRYVLLDPSQCINLIQETSIYITDGTVSECRALQRSRKMTDGSILRRQQGL